MLIFIDFCEPDCDFLVSLWGNCSLYLINRPQGWPQNHGAIANSIERHHQINHSPQ